MYILLKCQYSRTDVQMLLELHNNKTTHGKKTSPWNPLLVVNRTVLYFHCDLHNDWANCKVMIWAFPNQTLHFYTSTVKLIMMTDVFRSHYIWTIAILTKTKPQETSNQIKSLLLSHHHSTCALVSVILESVLQTVQKQFTNRQYILTDLYRRQCAEYTYIYSVHTVYY